MEGMTRDLRHAVRGLLRAPGYTLSTVMTLALGLGGAVAVLALGATVLRPLPFPEPDRLVAVSETHRGEAGSVAPANYLDWRRTSTSFQGLAAYGTRSVSLTFDGEARRGGAAEVSGNFFQILGVAPVLGRTFDARVNVAFPAREAVVSHALWADALGGDPGVTGRTFQVDDLTYEVVGVMPTGFAFPDPSVQVWLRSPREAPDIRSFTGDLTTLRDAWYFDVVGRLAPGVAIARASAEMNALATRLEELHPETNQDRGVVLTPLLQETVAAFRPTLLALALAVMLLLAAACVNVAHLVLARSATRREALAVRVALGATRGALVRHVLAEGWILGLGGSLVGAALAMAAVRATVTVFGAALPRAPEVAVRPEIVAAALILGVALTTVVTLLTFRAPQATPGAHLRNRSGGARTRDGLVAAQVAAAVALSAGSALVGRSLLNLSHVDPGFDAHGMVTLRVSLPDARLRPFEERLQVYRALVERLASVNGVTAVGLGSTSPLASGPNAGIFLAGALDEQNPPNTGWQPVDPGYFAALGVPLVRGRVFDGQDGPGRDVGIVNEALAQIRFPGEDPLGRQVTIGLDGHDRPITIVGVVGNTRTRGPAQDPGPVLFRPMAQTRSPGYSADAAFLAIRAAGAPSSLPATLRETIHQDAPGMPVYAVTRGEDLLRPFLQGSAGILLVLSVFAVTTLLLCAVGVYGVTSYLVRQGRREFGIRMAVGADAARVMREVLGRGMGRAALGVPLGLLLTFALGRALRAVLFDVPPTDVLAYGAAGGLVLAVAAAALWIPARMAAGTDAAAALRGD
jgi:predicted permease